MRPSGAMSEIRMGWSAVRMPRCLVGGGCDAKALLERNGGRWGPDLRAVDHEDVDVTVFLPLARAFCEAVERMPLVAGRHILAHPLQPSVAEARRVGVEAREFVVVVINDRHAMLSAKVEEAVIAEAFVPRLDRMSQAHSVDFRGQELEEAGDILAIELATLVEHPQDRPELGSERRKSLSDEIADPFCALGKL